MTSQCDRVDIWPMLSFDAAENLRGARKEIALSHRGTKRIGMIFQRDPMAGKSSILVLFVAILGLD